MGCVGDNLWWSVPDEGVAGLVAEEVEYVRDLDPVGGAKAAGEARRLVVQAVHPGVGLAGLKACLGDPDRRNPDEAVGEHGSEQIPVARSRSGGPVPLDRSVRRAAGAGDCGESGLVDQFDHASRDEADPGVVPVRPSQETHAAASAPSQRVERVLRQRVAVDDRGERQASPRGRIGPGLDLPGDSGRRPNEPFGRAPR